MINKTYILVLVFMLIFAKTNSQVSVPAGQPVQINIQPSRPHADRDRPKRNYRFDNTRYRKYRTWEFSYGTFTNTSQNPFYDDFSIRKTVFTTRIISGHFFTILEVSLNGNIGISLNNGWICNAFNKDISDYNSSNFYGASLGVRVGTMTRVCQFGGCSINIGPEMGLCHNFYPNIKFTSTGVENFCFTGPDINGTFGIKLNFYLSKKFFLIFEYTTFIPIIFNNTINSPITLTLTDNGTSLNTVQPKFGTIRYGLGFKVFK